MPCAREIGRRRADHAPRRRDLARHQARRRQVGDPQGDVEPFLHRVDLLVAQDELDVKLRVLPHEVGDRAAEMERAERHRGVDPQNAARLGLQARHREIGFLQIGEDRGATLEIGLAVLGRRGAAGGTEQQLDPEILLEVDDVFAHRRAR